LVAGTALPARSVARIEGDRRLQILELARFHQNVAFERQLPNAGIRVANIPVFIELWTRKVPGALVMAPPHATDKNPDSYIGKLVVMLQSRDATAPPADWANQPVNGREGKFDVQDDTQILTFKNASGQWVVIQAPVSLGWDSAELAKFAGGVQVLAAAQQGRG
jgi:hypothetical protein